MAYKVFSCAICDKPEVDCKCDRYCTCANHPLECGFVRMGCSIVRIAGKLAITVLRIKFRLLHSF